MSGKWLGLGVYGSRRDGYADATSDVLGQSWAKRVVVRSVRRLALVGAHRDGVNTAPIPYDHRLVRGLRRLEERIAQAKALERVARESGGNVKQELRSRHTAADGITLRGIPAVGLRWPAARSAGHHEGRARSAGLR